MKIAFIGQKGIPARNGGVERCVESLATNLVKLNQEVFVYNRNNYLPEKITEYKGVKIINLPSWHSKNLEAISHTFLACLHVLRHKVDIIHFQSIGPASLIWLIKLFKPRSVVVFTFHCQDYYHQKWGLFARLYLRFGEMIGCKFADEIITISKELTEYVKNRYQRDSIYIPNGADLVDKLEAQEIKRWGLEAKNYIVYIGRLVRHKGIHNLIIAYEKLKTAKKLVIVGEGAFTDDYVNELHTLAIGNKNIIFTGNQEGKTLAELYSNAYLFVQPSENEGLSIALLEAMAHKTPCLVSDIRANIEAIDNCGYTFKVDNADDLKIQLENLLANPADLALKADLAYERVKKFYSWPTIAKEVLEVYRKSEK